MSYDYGETLKKRRKARGITLLELSEKTGVDPAILVEVELGRAHLMAEERQRISAFVVLRLAVPSKE